MHKIITIVGARPQIIKAAALSRAFNNFPEITELIVHTGQHYDFNMSAIFFEELNIPLPKYQLEVDDTDQDSQTAQMIAKLEPILLSEEPDLVIVYGDTNSTLAGTLAASKLQIPLVHIEAGMRSFNKSMPEELNRIIADSCSTLLFSPTLTGIENLKQEGFSTERIGTAGSNNPHIFHCGDIMLDNSLFFSATVNQKSTILQKLNLEKNKFILSTIHRSATTDNSKRLSALLKSLINLAQKFNEIIVFPIHPRTLKQLKQDQTLDIYNQIQTTDNIILTEPLSYLDMIQLEQNSKLIITDSGGVQKEAYFFQKPCIIARKETEWKELTDLGAAILCDVDLVKIESAYLQFIKHPTANFPPIFGDGNSANFIDKELDNYLNKHLKIN